MGLRGARARRVMALMEKRTCPYKSRTGHASTRTTSPDAREVKDSRWRSPVGRMRSSAS